VHCGFGFGVVFVNPALHALGWDPPRFCVTAFQNAWLNPILWNAFMGWTGVHQYDEGNMVRRPQWCVPVVNRDIVCTLLRELTDAHPLSPRGRQGGTRASQDDAGRVRRTGNSGVIRQLDPPGMNGRDASVTLELERDVSVTLEKDCCTLALEGSR
jgi:hypothetical protein